MKLKILDWKSFAIGVLLTATALLGTGATSSPLIISWDPTQQWEYKTSNTKKIPHFQTALDVSCLIVSPI